MKCPYIWNTIEYLHNKKPQISEFNIENADRTPDRIHLSVNDSAYTRTRYFHDCLKDECACFQDNKCTRR